MIGEAGHQARGDLVDRAQTVDDPQDAGRPVVGDDVAETLELLIQPGRIVSARSSVRWISGEPSRSHTPDSSDGLVCSL